MMTASVASVVTPLPSRMRSETDAVDEPTVFVLPTTMVLESVLPETEFW